MGEKMSRFVKIFLLSQILVITFVIIFVTIYVNNTGYLDDLSAEDLLNNSSAVVETDGGTKRLDKDIILEFADGEIDNIKDFAIIKANNSKNINEMGIFRVENGEAEDLAEDVKEYVAGKQKSYRTLNYLPEEAQKIDNARVKVLGNYVIYSFLNEEDTIEFYKQAEKLIKK